MTSLGMLIAFEGIDASGKNTQSKRLSRYLTEIGVDNDLYSFPRYETPMGAALLRHLKKQTLVADTAVTIPSLLKESDRFIPLSDVTRMPLSDFADLLRHADDPLIFQSMMLTDKEDAAVDIEQHLADGRVVICDRWWPSAWAYGGSDGLDETWLRRIHKRLPQPDLALLLDVPAEIARERRPEARDRYEEKLDQLRDICRRYNLLWNEMTTQISQNTSPWISLDGTADIETVTSAIMSRFKVLNATRQLSFIDNDGQTFFFARNGNAVALSWIGEDGLESEPQISCQRLLEWSRALKTTPHQKRYQIKTDEGILELSLTADEAIPLARGLIALTLL